MKILAMIPAIAVVMTVITPEANAAVSSGDVSVMLSNVINDLGGENSAFLTFFWMFCRLAGLILVISGIAHLVKREGITGGITSILIGALLIALPDTLSIFNRTVFNSDAATSIMSNAAKTDILDAKTAIFVNFSVMMIQFVGFMALYRGLRTFADVALSGQRHQPDQTRAAWIFVIMGILCINIIFTLGVCAATLGGESLEFYNRIFR